MIKVFTLTVFNLINYFSNYYVESTLAFLILLPDTC